MSTDDGGSMVCPVHGTRTRVSCARCGRPICPRCMVPSPVGFTCDEHPQRYTRFVRWLPARGPVRPFRWTGLVVLGALVLVCAPTLRAAAGFALALDRTVPWVGIVLFLAIVAAMLLLLVYAVRRLLN